MSIMQAEDPIHRIGDITMDIRFWDCECEEKYIHSKKQHDLCRECGTWVEDGPDSRTNEIKLKNMHTILDAEDAISYGYTIF